MPAVINDIDIRSVYIPRGDEAEIVNLLVRLRKNSDHSNISSRVLE